jgi:4-hydroxybenzoate polyprenyltransferase
VEAWSALLSGAVLLGEKSPNISPGFVFRQTALCILAAYLFCGAGMVWNDWVDRDTDIHVARTKNRPLAAGTITTAEAMIWTMAQVTMSWGVLRIMLEGNDVLWTLFPQLCMHGE